MVDINKWVGLWFWTSILCSAIMFLCIYSIIVSVNNSIYRYEQKYKTPIPDVFQFPSLFRLISGWPMDLIKLALLMFIPGVNIFLVITNVVGAKKTISFFVERIIKALVMAEKVKEMFSQAEKNDPPENDENT